MSYIISYRKRIEYVNTNVLVHSPIIGRYCLGQPAFIPATPLGVLEILKRCHVDTFGKTACIVGRSKNIGKCNKRLLISTLD